MDTATPEEKSKTPIANPATVLLPPGTPEWMAPTFKRT